MNKDEKKRKVDFLSDEPIKELEADEFGHLSVAKTLKDSLDRWKGKRPFTIGLFGGWGTGKSGIGTLLSDLFNKSAEKDVATVEFDIWKYEKDSFRRQFLIFLNSEEGLNTNLGSIKNLYITKIDEHEEPDVSQKDRDFRWWIKRILKTGLVVVLLVLAERLIFITSEYKLVQSGAQILGVLSGVGAFWILAASEVLNKFSKLLIESAMDEWKTLFKNKKFWNMNHQVTFPEKFEKYFDEIIQEAKDKRGLKRIVIIIDNLDRVHDDKILELLLSVKTYLERPDVAFIIQCDDEAIRRHLRHIYTHNQESRAGGNHEDIREYADEFLRKFFNTYVRIPPLLEGDLYKYTRNLLERTKLPVENSDKVVAAISSSHRGNQRRVKQFINVLVSRYFLAYNKENGGKTPELPPGAVTDNLEMLTKVLIFEQKFPSFYEQLRETPQLWKHVDAYIRTEKLPDDDFDRQRLEELLEKEGDLKTSELKRFLISTKTVITSDISPFIFLKQPYVYQSVDSAIDLRQSLEDDDRTKVEKLLSDVSSEKVSAYQDFIFELLNASENRIRIFNIINSCLSFAEKNGSFFQRSFFDKLAHFVIDQGRNKRKYPLEGFDITLIFKSLVPNVSEIIKKQLLHKIAVFFTKIGNSKSLEETADAYQYTKDFVLQLSKNVDLFEPEEINIIKKALKEQPFFAADIEIIKPIFDSSLSIENLVSSKFIKLIIDTLNHKDALQDENSVLLLKISSILTARNHIDESLSSILIKKMTSILSQDEIIEQEEAAERANVSMNKILDQLADKIKIEGDIQSLAKRLKANYEKAPSKQIKILLASNATLLRDIMESNLEKPISQVVNLTREIFMHAPVSEIKEVISKIDFINIKENEVYDSYRDILESRSMNDDDFFDLLIKEYSPPLRDALIAKRIQESSKYRYAVSKLDQLESFEEKSKLAKSIISRARKEGFPHKINLLRSLIKISCDDQGVKDMLVNLLKEILEDPNIHPKNASEACSFISDCKAENCLSEQDIKKLVTSTIEKIQRLGVNRAPKYLKNLSCVIDILATLPENNLDEEKKEEFTSFIISVLKHHLGDNQITHTTFEWLNKLDARYASNKDKYENLHSSLIKKDQKTQKIISNKILSLGLVDKRSPKFYKKIKDLSQSS